MHICICIKQVPDTAEVRIDPETNTLHREGVPSILNPFDAYALEIAARLQDQDPSVHITVLSLGPAQAAAALKECLAIGADKACLVSDRVFGGSDTLATSYALAQAIRTIEQREGYAFDAVFCGKQAIDGDTAQVGPELAEHLGLPQVTCALSAERGEGNLLLVRRETDDGVETVEVPLPCLCTVTKFAGSVRCPTLKRKLAANRAQISVLTAEDLPSLEQARVGIKGSPTRVVKTYVAPAKRGGVTIQADTAQESASQLFQALRQKQIL